MSDGNGSGPHKTAPELPIGRPFAPGPDPRRNTGGRPRGLAALVRQAVGDGDDLVQFYRAVFAGDAKAIGERRPISLRDRMLAGEWLASRGFGRAPVAIEPPDAAAGPLTAEQVGALKEMPPELKEAIRHWLRERREAYIAQQREEAERRMLEFMPSAGQGHCHRLEPR